MFTTRSTWCKYFCTRTLVSKNTYISCIFRSKRNFFLIWKWIENWWLYNELEHKWYWYSTGRNTYTYILFCLYTQMFKYVFDDRTHHQIKNRRWKDYYQHTVQYTGTRRWCKSPRTRIHFAISTKSTISAQFYLIHVHPLITPK